MTFRMSSRALARPARPARLAALALLPVLALTACGGGGGGYEDGGAGTDAIADAPGGPATTGAGATGGSGAQDQGAAAGKGAFYDAQMKYVLCMRTKGGAKDYPDPKLSGHLDWAKVAEVSDPRGNGEDQKGGRGGACATEMRAAMELEPKRDTQKDYESMLAHATCMRDKGVSKFANPTMSGGNVLPGGDPNPANPALDVNSPAYKEARQACADKLLDGLDGMQ